MSFKNITNERMEELSERARRCCCKYCGSSLEVRLIVFGKLIEADAEVFCSNCNRIEYGTESLIYQNARYLVDTMNVNCFPDLDDDERTRQMNIAKICDIIGWNCQSLGILDQEGFNIPVKGAEGMIDHYDGSFVYQGEPTD